jgi:hypothetical protein
VEFFAVAQVDTSVAELQALARIEALPSLCASVDRVLWSDGERGEIYCLWGQFGIHREILGEGVRFSLPRCPNALAWTLTTGHPPAGRGVLVHCTIARTGHEPDFVESLEMFVADWRDGLLTALGAGR